MHNKSYWIWKQKKKNGLVFYLSSIYGGYLRVLNNISNATDTNCITITLQF